MCVTLPRDSQLDSNMNEYTQSDSKKDSKDLNNAKSNTNAANRIHIRRDEVSGGIEATDSV